MTSPSSLDGVSCLVAQKPAPRSPTLRALEGRNFVQVFPEYIAITDSLPAAILLGWLVYWFLPAADGTSKLKGTFDGKRWFSRSYRELELELKLSKHFLIKARTALHDLGLIVVRDGSYAGRRTLCWHLNLKALDTLLASVTSHHEAASGPTADSLMLSEFEEITVEGTIDHTSTHPQEYVPSVVEAPAPVTVLTFSKPIKKNPEEYQETTETPGGSAFGAGLASLASGKGELKNLSEKSEKNAKLAKVRAKYGKPKLNVGSKTEPKPLKTPNLPWLGIHAKPGPGSGGLHLKNEVSNMAVKFPEKFSDKLKQPAKSLDQWLAENKAAKAEQKTSPSQGVSPSLLKKPHLSALQAEFIWKRHLSEKLGFQKPFSLKEKGQLSQLCKRLSTKDLIDVLAFVLADGLTVSGLTSWGNFAARVRTAKGLVTSPQDPHVGFLFAHYEVAVQMLREKELKKAAQPASPSPAAPAVQAPPLIVVHAPTPTPSTPSQDDHKVQLGIALLNGIKVPDLTPEQIEAYKALAKNALAEEE